MRPFKSLYEVPFGSILASTIIAGFLVYPAFGQDKAAEKAEKTVGPFLGTVVDSAEKPVAGAKVWLQGGRSYPDGLQVLAQTTSDEKGRFQLEKVKYENPPNRGVGITFLARDAKGRMGGSHSIGQTPLNAQSKEMQIKLQEVKDCQGRLIDASGQPIAKAKIRPTAWDYIRRDGNFRQEIFFIHTDLGNELAAETGADGSFTLRNVPAIGRINAKISAKGFGEPYAMWNVQKPPTFQIAPVGAVRGAVTCSKDNGAAAGVKLRLQQGADGERYIEADSMVTYFAEGESQKDGAFDFDQVPPGKYSVNIELADDSAYYYDGKGLVEVKSGETANVSLELKPAVKLQGKVVDQKTGEGLAGVRVNLYFNDSRGQAGRQNTATTDAAGAFTIYTRPGKAQVNVWQIPEQYVNPSSSRQMPIVEIKEKEDTTMEPIQLARASVLEGIVVDKSGNPVADAEVRYTDTRDYDSLHEIIRSDAAGKFTLKKISPQKTYIVRARTANAVADPVNVAPAEQKEPLKVVILEKTAFTVRGAIVDDAGKPLPGAEIGLMAHWRFGSGGVGFQFSTCKTDDAGKFEYGGLWPGDEYEIRVTAKGYEKNSTRQVESTPGGVHDFGKITLIGAAGAVEGTVVDSSGKPLAGARVFNSGDGPEPMETRSDDAGKFSLKGFRKGPVFVFAEKDGFRFSGLHINSGTTDAVLKMPRTDEPAVQRPPYSPTSLNEEEKKAAHVYLEKIWATTTGNQRRSARYKMARIDPELAAKWVVEAKVKPQDIPEPKSMEKIAEDDLDEALSQIAKQGAGGYYALYDLAKHFAQSDPEKAMRCAEEAVIRARSLDQPQRTASIAQMGALVMRLGNKEAGKKLADEAAEMADKLQPSERNDSVFGAVAAALAQNDIARAKSLIEKIPDKNRRDYYLADVAASLDDVQQAESLLKDMESYYARRARMKLAYRIAPKRPAEAIRLVENAQTSRSPLDEDSKAMAFGWLAKAVAPSDPKLAHSLIDRAFAIYQQPAGYFYGGRGGRSAQAAATAVLANQIGYPDMESIVYRVLATRPTTKGGESPAAVQESCVVMAMYLALVDPQTAKQVLQSIEPTSDNIGSGYSGVGRDQWLKAWALVDPQHAVELTERELASAKNNNEKQRAENAVYTMVDLWFSLPGERLKNMSQNNREILPPEEEF
ncbi:MAG: carboxypeptidase regulatory-like domain-containing protein [Thermoguttaceae bacterium]|jgi:protocatechuate 3,4-dioxygenase beta subunit/tetratricopeptide (TPR) repeat protein